MSLPRSARRVSGRVGAALVAALLTVLAAPAFAAEGSIDHVESHDGAVEVLFSLPGVGETSPDLGTLEVTLDGEPVEATATLASDAKHGVRRTAILAIDVSDSMAADGKFAAAKRAAQIFLDSAPADLYVGVVTFAGKVTVAQAPSRDRAESAAVINGLKLSRGTFLYDGVLRAVASSGDVGQRGIIVLSDGHDTSTTNLASVTGRIEAADIKVDVIALAQSAVDEALLEPLSSAGNGSVISAADPAALGRVFADEAQTLAKQLQITSTPPDASKREGTLSVSVAAADQTFTDAAFVTISGDVKAPSASTPSTKLVAPPSGMHLTSDVLTVGLLALGAGALVLMLIAFGALGRKPEDLASTIAPYTRKGAAVRGGDAGPQGVTAQAVGIASKALAQNEGLEVKLGAKLEAGGLSLKPAEWLLVHAGIAVGATSVVFLLTGGGLMLTGVAFLVGVLLPWMYLGRKQSKRLKAFNSQLAPTLQLMAGSLQAGLSLPQGMDTIVREGAEPMSTEFRRALVETRLGVAIEVALESVGERMMSDDFQWTVMAIRIQREVGGNLAELLLSVAGTLRERDYLRRQIRSLSAQGRISAYILLAMPPGILLYEFVTNRSYIEPLYSTGIGFVMLGVMVLMMGLGSLMMKKMIKVEV